MAANQLGEQLRRLPLERPDLFAAVDVVVAMSFNLALEAAGLIAGEICIGCGCTDQEACPGGCSWASLVPPICSGCADLFVGFG